MRRRRSAIVAAAVAAGVALTGTWWSGQVPASASAGARAAGTGLPAATTTAQAAPAAAAPIPGPVPRGRLRIRGTRRDGSAVSATGLAWHPARLPAGDKLLSFAVSYAWQSCAATCTTAADSTATPFAARRYIAGHGDTGRRIKVTETAAEVVETDPATFAFSVVRASASFTTTVTAGAYPGWKAPGTEYVNGTPERRTSSAEEYFQGDPPHYNAGNGTPVQQYRIDRGPWR